VLHPTRPCLPLLLLAALLAGCGGDGPLEVAEVGQDPSPSPSATADTSIEDALARAGVSDELALELGAVAGRTGYGLSRGVPMPLVQSRSFAFVQVDTCRDIATGATTWERVVARDVADGASRSDAEQMASFLQSTFCPVVRPEPGLDTTPTTSAGPASATDDNGTRGLLSDGEWLAGRWKAVPYDRCLPQLGQPSDADEARAFELRAGVLLCTSLPSRWHSRSIDMDLVFAEPVPEATALQLVAPLLPPDAQLGTREVGSNPPHAPAPGTCVSIQWTSEVLRTAVAEASPSWSDSDEASVVLYSSQQTDTGSADAYDGTVKQAALATGGHSFGYKSDVVTC
jgi:predicted small lipoprotein YifL